MARPTDDEIDDQLERAYDHINEGRAAWPGMTYEQGVVAGIEWMRDGGDVPMEDE